MKHAPLLIASHILALAGGYGLMKIAAPHSAAADEVGAPNRDGPRARDRRQPAASDGEALLKEFMSQPRNPKSRFEELKETLPATKDPKSALIAALDKLAPAEGLDRLTDDERLGKMAEIEVLAFRWLEKDPMAAMDFLLADRGDTWPFPLIYSLNTAIKEAAAQKGTLASIPWLTKDIGTLAILSQVALDEIKAGGGLPLFLKVEATMNANPLGPEFQKYLAGMPGERDPFGGGGDFLQSVGKATAFPDRDVLLSTALSRPRKEETVALLSGFASSGTEAADWVMKLIEREAISPEIAAELMPSMGQVALRAPSMDWDHRIQARRATRGNETKARQSIIDELVKGDINQFLNEGRDWRYEFRHGVSTADEVLSAVRSGLPGSSAADESEFLVSVYRQLAEENPRKALPLLDSLTEEQRRAALFNSTWQNFGHISPDAFLTFHADVPEPVTPEEKDLRTRGWNWRAREYLHRFGDDYVEWVKELPPGIDKDAAMNSLVWATRERNPTKARELSDQLYPKKP